MRPRALTLFQLLVALALAMTLLGAVFLFLHDLIDSRERAVERSRREDAVAALFERLESDLSLAIAGEPSVGSGVMGDATSLAVLVRDVQPSIDAPRQGLLDLHRHEYRHDADAQALVGTRALARGGAAETIVFDGRVARLRFRYHDGHEWRNAFDSRSAGGLPAAIEVAVWFDLPDAVLAELDHGEEAETFLDQGESADEGGESAAPMSPPADEAMDVRALPPPDRLRVIAVPDGGVPESQSTAPEPLPPAEDSDEPETDEAGAEGATARAPTQAGLRSGALASALAIARPSPTRRTRSGAAAQAHRASRTRRPRRAFLLVTMLVVLAIALSVVAGLVMLARGDAAIAATHEQAAQARALAWSGVQAVGVSLEDQRERMLAGEAPAIERQLVIYEAGSTMGVVRLLPVGIDSRGDASHLRAEGGLLDLNRADTTALAASGMVDSAQAEAIVAARAAAGGRFLSESELIGVADLSPEQVFGSLEALAWAADASRQIEPGRRSAEEVATTSSAESFGVQAAANGLFDVVTVFAIEPLVTADGREKVSLAGGWSPEISEALESVVDAEFAKAIEGLLKSGTPDSDAALIKLLRQREASVTEWRRVLDAVTVHPGPWIGGRVDLNTAPYEAILATPSITPQQAAEIVRQREDLEASERASPTWLLTRGIVQGDQFEALVDRVTTRCFLWRMRMAAGEVSTDDPDGPLHNAVVWEVVIDLTTPRWRVAYLRDATLLPLAAALISGEPEENEQAGNEGATPGSAATHEAPDGASAEGGVQGDDESADPDADMPEAEAPPDEAMPEPERPGITAPTRRWSGQGKPTEEPAPAAPGAPPKPKAPAGPAPVGRWRTS